MIAYLNRYGSQIRIGLIVIGLLIGLLLFFGMPVFLVQSSIRRATPYILGSLAALLASRAGVLNLAIEGKMLLGAFCHDRRAV
jgi:ABC-type uncharacterized transport system permease subunit